jgi:hypothetical protein
MALPTAQVREDLSRDHKERKVGSLLFFPVEGCDETGTFRHFELSGPLTTNRERGVTEKGHEVSSDTVYTIWCAYVKMFKLEVSDLRNTKELGVARWRRDGNVVGRLGLGMRRAGYVWMATDKFPMPTKCYRTKAVGDGGNLTWYWKKTHPLLLPLESPSEWPEIEWIRTELAESVPYKLGPPQEALQEDEPEDESEDEQVLEAGSGEDRDSAGSGEDGAEAVPRVEGPEADSGEDGESAGSGEDGLDVSSREDGSEADSGSYEGSHHSEHSVDQEELHSGEENVVRKRKAEAEGDLEGAQLEDARYEMGFTNAGKVATCLEDSIKAAVRSSKYVT